MMKWLSVCTRYILFDHLGWNFCGLTCAFAQASLCWQSIHDRGFTMMIILSENQSHLLLRLLLKTWWWYDKWRRWHVDSLAYWQAELNEKKWLWSILMTIKIDIKLASWVLRLRIGFINPFLVLAKKTRLGPVIRVGIVLISWC